MTRTLTLWLSPALALAALLACGAPAFAQTTPAGKDDVLDGLLKKLEDKEKAEEKAPPSATKPASEGAKAVPSAGPTRPAAGEISSKDKELDSLLEKLGATEDKPAPDERRPGASKPDDDATPPPSKPGDEKKKSQELKGRDKDVDEHLEELTGKRRKKKNEDEEGGPLSEVVKQMREVERRLSQPDTGEETRKKQEQIVKRIETLIEQVRSSSQAQRRQRQNRPMKPGEQNRELTDQPGENGGNAPFTKPSKPENRRSMAGGKDAWGHLPPELRQEMDNVFKEDPLPSREELIRRYYLSVSQKNLARGR